MGNSSSKPSPPSSTRQLPPSNQPPSQPPRKTIIISSQNKYKGLDIDEYAPIYFDKVTYPTCRLMYLSLQFLPHRPDIMRSIVKSNTAEAINIVKHNERWRRSDWNRHFDGFSQTNAMSMALHYKLRGSNDLQKLLHGTGNAELVLNSTDRFWGRGTDGKGQNKFGELLETLRNTFIKKQKDNQIPLPTLPALPKSSPFLICDNGKGKLNSDFTISSPHRVKYMRRSYKTGEHLFQALKFLNRAPHIAERLQECANVQTEAKKYKHDVRPDWEKVDLVMLQMVLYHKFLQHHDLLKALLNTGDAEIQLISNDPSWGHPGNQYGKILMRLREEFRMHMHNSGTWPKPP